MLKAGGGAWLPGGTGCWARSRCGWTAAPLPLPGARQRLLLAMLLVNANRMVPAVRLIDELWERTCPPIPARRCAPRCPGCAGRSARPAGPGHPRRGLPPHRPARPARLLPVRGRAGRGGRGPTANRPCACSTRPLALCRGPALGEFADRPFALATAARLEELRVVAAERQAGLLLSLGRVEEAVAALQALLAEHPEREQARGLLMQALYRAGRHTEALATIRSWRRHLATELGLDPSPALQAHRAGHLAPHGRDAGYPRRRPRPGPAAAAGDQLCRAGRGSGGRHRAAGPGAAGHPARAGGRGQDPAGA